ncbi:Cytoplasmic glyoxalase II [Agyrium rufum]|nr:Cytoplasmic glyoxalase II [Agyrium rufum]
MTDIDQNAGFRRSMFDVGVEVGIPASWVELRHEITHGDLPSLLVLRRAAERALRWLYDNYWNHLVEKLGVAYFNQEIHVEDLKGSLKEILRDFVKKNIERMRRVDRSDHRDPEETDSTSAKITRLCRGERKLLRALCSVLVQRKILIPTSRMIGTSMQEVFLLWDDLLKRIYHHQPHLLNLLIDELTLALVPPSQLDPKTDDYRESCMMWISHILIGDTWKSQRKSGMILVETVLTTCVMNPGLWTVRLALEIVDHPAYATASDRYGSQVWRLLGEHAVEYRGERTETVNAIDAAQIVDTTVTSPQSWTPKPIGFVLIAIVSGARAMHIQSIPMWTGGHDNYAYLVIDDKTKDAVIIDPANPPEVTPILKEQVDSGKINLTAIINTHHHWDHAGGNKKILSEFPSKSLPVIAGKDSEAVTRTPADGETFKIGEGISVKALHTPCHTQDSICWFMEDLSQGQRVVFTGDTLFIGGCGRFFEGTPKEMYTALNKILASLPDDTKVYPGHEYTKSNAKFLAKVLSTEPVKKLQDFAENNKETQGKFTIGDEKTYNVFMMVDDPTVQKVTGKTDPVDVMGKLREMKNSG